MKTRTTILLATILSGIPAYATETSAIPKLRAPAEITDQNLRDAINSQERDNGINVRLEHIKQKHAVACEGAKTLEVSNEAFKPALLALKIECGAIGLKDIEKLNKNHDFLLEVWRIISPGTVVSAYISGINLSIMSEMDLKNHDEREKAKKLMRYYKEKNQEEIVIKSLKSVNNTDEVDKLIKEISMDRINAVVY